jgi:hypothetical protein
MLVKGKFTEIKRIRVPCPQDGVHQASDKDGMMKGCHSVWLTRKDGSQILCPKGQTCFYLHYKPGKGLKIFFKPETLVRFKRRAMLREWHNRVKLHEERVSPRPYAIRLVKLDVEFEGKRSKTTAWAIKTQHIHAPEKAWENYAKGIPYDFTSYDHPLHSPEGYKEFCQKVRKALKKTGVVICKGKPSLKLGDVMWDTVTNRWYLADCG